MFNDKLIGRPVSFDVPHVTSPPLWLSALFGCHDPIHLERRGRDPQQMDLARLALLSDGFSGAEIEESIISALLDAFSSDGKLTTETVEASITATVPLSKTMSEELTRLRGWAQGRTRPASGPAAAAPEMRRKIELDFPGSSSQEGARA